MLSPARAKAQLVALDRYQSKQSLSNFVPLAWAELEPAATYVPSWQVDAVCEHLEAVTYGWCNRLLINVPPGSMKSLLSSVMWPAWEWGPMERGATRYLATAFNDGPVKRDTRKMRDLVSSPWYQDRWPDIKLVRSGETSFANSKTGSREGVPFPSLTSQRGDRLIIDDPHSTTTAESDTERKRTVRQFREGAINRLNDQERSAIVVIMQRLHEGDISGEILSSEMGYVHLCLPMEYEPSIFKMGGHVFDPKKKNAIGFVDPRTTEGELLNPGRFNAKVVADLKRDMGEYAYCTPGESPVLMADLTLKPISQVRTDDVVVGFGTDVANGAQRKHLMPARVGRVSQWQKEVVKITLSSGKVIRCTPDHPWYTGRGASRPEYLPAKIGNLVMRVCDDKMPELKSWQVRDAGAYGNKFIIAKEKVVSIEPDGVETVYGLTTETGNYVVWGLASSNTGQYQQRPVPREGGLFKRQWFENRILGVAPPGTMWIRHWDLAASKNKGAWTAGVKLGRMPDGRFVVGHVNRFREEGDVVRKNIKLQCELDGYETTVSIPQDGGQAGKVQKQDMLVYLAGFTVRVLLEASLGDKQNRASPFSVQCEAGNVFLVKGDWNEDYLDELCLFPGGKFKDQVDASSGAFAQHVMGPAQPIFGSQTGR